MYVGQNSCSGVHKYLVLFEIRSTYVAIFISLTVLHHIRDIKDPEYPNYTLEQLQVVTEVSVEIDVKHSHVRVTFSPTVRNCKMAPAIGLFLQVKLMCSLPACYKVDIRVAPGTLDNEDA
ncbi:hypothetical protein MKX03_020187, partial [Papaver bracteatum]